MRGPTETVATGRAREIVPPDIAAALRPRLRGIAEEMAREIQLRVPEYARSSDAYARTVLAGSERTLHDFLDGVADGGPADGGGPHEDGAYGSGAGGGRHEPPVTEVFRRIARGEARCNRSLDALQAAMHVGAEVIWRRLSASCLELGMADERLCRLAEALLYHFRQNATAAADGYVEARTRLTSEVQRRQRHLLELLLSDPPVSPEAIERVAGAARWRIPETVSVVVLADRGGTGTGSFDLPPEILVDLDRPEPCLVVPDPGRRGRARTLDLALRGASAVVGPPMPLADAAKSLRWAGQAAGLVERGVITGADVVHCVEHLSTLVLFQNEELINTLAALRLAPLAGLRPAQRDRLADTLLAWLQTGGDAVDVAARLHVHPQTVRYRIRQLQELFGDRLRDPDVRLELEMVLQARRLRGGETGRPARVVRLVTPARDRAPG